MMSAAELAKKAAACAAVDNHVTVSDYYSILGAQSRSDKLFVLNFVLDMSWHGNKLNLTMMNCTHNTLYQAEPGKRKAFSFL